MIKVFTLNENGKIELTEKELKQLLDNVYWEGYKDNNKSWTYSTPISYPYITLTSNSVTLDSTSERTIINEI